MAEKDVNEQVQESAENQAGAVLNSDDSQAGSTHLNEPVENEPEIEKIKTELQDAKDRYLRLAAEFENFKRRTAKERLELIQTAGKDVIVDLLPVLDDSDRAQKQLETTDDAQLIKEGVALVFQKLRHTLQSRGVKAMDTIGKEFDADLHEAITEIPAASEDKKGKVVDEVIKGYYLNDKIIRHAKVVVGK